MTVYAASTTPAFFPITRWMSSVEANKARALWEVRAASGALDVTLGFQSANDVEAPDAPTALSAYSSSTGLVFPGAFANVTAGTKTLVRFGWMCKLPTATSTVLATIAGQLEYAR